MTKHIEDVQIMFKDLKGAIEDVYEDDASHSRNFLNNSHEIVTKEIRTLLEVVDKLYNNTIRDMND